ncbi:MAG: hypothetical protein JXC32_10255 [Anaerolineae bacterium]|nr:hypothetical protein [Anaerolineae bacterium]
MKSQTSRFPLLPYRILAKRWRGPAFLMIPAGVALTWALPYVPGTDPAMAPMGLGISVIGLLIFAYTLLMARAHVSCHSNRFVVHGPLYPVAFSYQRIDRVGSAEFSRLFPPENAKAAIWRLYRDLWGTTVPTLSLKDLPLPKWWLRLWLHPYLFHPTETGLVVPVEEWLTFIREIETLRTQWRERR